MSNNLSRIDYGVFYPVLQQMAPYPTCSPNNYCIDLSNSKFKKVNNLVRMDLIIENDYADPIDCEGDPCHLAWLIRDNRHLMKYIGYSGRCSNYTSLSDLDPNTICPVVITQSAPAVCPPVDSYWPCTCSGDASIGDNSTILLDCGFKQLGDERMNEILNVFLTTPGVSAVSTMYLYGNGLTKVPQQVAKFSRLSSVSLSGNAIRHIASGAFDFSSTPLRFLYLSRNEIVSIEPDAFKDCDYYFCYCYNMFFIHFQFNIAISFTSDRKSVV